MPISRVRFGGGMWSGTRTPGYRPRTALDDSTPRSPDVARCASSRLHPTNIPPLRHPLRLGHPADQTPHRCQLAAHPPRRARQRPPHRLPTRALPRSLLGPGAGFLLTPVLPEGTVVLVGEDTLDGHPGTSQPPRVGDNAWVVSEDGAGAGPCLFGLYTVVVVLDQALPKGKRSGSICWPGKAPVTSSDALCPIRLRLWSEGYFDGPRAARALRNSPNRCRSSSGEPSRWRHSDHRSAAVELMGEVDPIV